MQICNMFFYQVLTLAKGTSTPIFSSIRSKQKCICVYKEILQKNVRFDTLTGGWEDCFAALASIERVSGKRSEHRVVGLYGHAVTYNAPFDFIFGVDKL